MIGCIAVGIAQRGIQEAIAYGKERIQFGKPIIKNQALQFKIADMEIKTETARQMVAHALTKNGFRITLWKRISYCKMLCRDIAMQVSSEAIQCLVDMDTAENIQLKKLLRDSKIFQIFEGTNEIQRIVIANNVIGR